MKYEQQTAETQRMLQTAKNILVVVPTQVSTDALASGLALYLSLRNGRQVSIVSEATLTVGMSNLFGVGSVAASLPATSGGNFILTLANVAADGGVPSLERLDYDTQGSDLRLVFVVKPGQKFEPTAITPSFAGSGFDLIFVVGSANLQNLGNIYNFNAQLFSQAPIVNIDNNQANAQFGVVNVVDSNSSSVSEIVSNLLFDSGSPVDSDIASNLVAGIYDGSQNLQSGAVNVETFTILAELLRRGGQKPGVSATPVSASDSAGVFNQLMQGNMPAPVTNPEPVQTAAPVSEPEPQPQPVPPFLQGVASGPTPERQFDAAPIQQPQENMPSPEEAPSGEGVQTASPEPDWLTPKIYKGGNVG
jgi:hypothetical protein